MSATINANLITNKLLNYCDQHHVICLYGVESGSRAWGFASQDSDYDVRFIYIRPRTDYLRLERPRDVLEYMDNSREFDFVGWDVIKALKLLSKSNPSIIEWRATPSVYYKDEAAFRILHEAAEKCFSAKTLALHYLSLGNDHVHKYIDGKTEIMPKRYFYTLRSILSASYVLNNSQPAPIKFSELLKASHLDSGLRSQIDHLLVSSYLFSKHRL